MTTLPVSPEYRSPIRVAVAFQVVMTLFLLTIFDDGTVAKVGACAMSGFWLGTSIVMLRRPRSPSYLDLLYVRWGYILMLVAGMFLLALMGIFLGHH